MGHYSIKYKSPYDTKTYDDIKNTYLWINNICKELDCIKISSNFLYHIGEICCSSNSFEEFQEEAFGQKIDFVSASVTVYFEDKKAIYFSFNYKFNKSDKNINISCDSRIDLSKILDIIKEIEKETNKLQSVVVQQNHYGDKIEINGNATVSGSNLGGHNNIINADTKKEGIWKDIFINIVSNWVWWLIATIIIILIGTVTAMNWSEIIKFIMGR